MVLQKKTARLFMHKVRVAMKSSGNYPMNGEINVDEFVVGGKEKGKVGRNYNSKRKLFVQYSLQAGGKSNECTLKRLIIIRLKN
ncbi:DDE transposase [Labilibaculum antarcticum]|uniref:DDE transposase n=1 Tax=Labilibaculum antarcticum TaxID=1717717 RepID=A0A1Y1CG25_9BACT|nr:DDE transposase [Labilibaculum antarcticum]